MNGYEAARSRNIARNKALIRDLGIQSASASNPKNTHSKPPQSKRQKLSHVLTPTRTSERLAAATTTPSYTDEADPKPRSTTKHRPSRNKRQSQHHQKALRQSISREEDGTPGTDLDLLRAGWTSWKPTASAPTRDHVTGTFHFDTHPGFTPNKSPAEMLREGAFGGSYFRPLYSARLHTTISDDWKELPTEWITGLSVDKYLFNPNYDPDINKYKVSCGQSIEQWEQNGWIDHTYDVRGWFQWYCRFFMGRRCDDDERQVSRWAKCVGERGRWRRALLKKYKQLGIRHVMTFGDDEEDDRDVSPVVHQTCHHWAFEVRQGVLDEFWNDEGA